MVFKIKALNQQAVEIEKIPKSGSNLFILLFSLTVNQGLNSDANLTYSHHWWENGYCKKKELGKLSSSCSAIVLLKLAQIYKMYVRPHLVYCDDIYNIPFIDNEFDSQITRPTSMER